MPRFLCVLFTLWLLYSCGNNDEGDDTAETNPTPFISYTLDKVCPHDTNSFTESLLVYDDRFYESTGSPGDMPRTKSIVGEVDLGTGK